MAITSKLPIKGRITNIQRFSIDDGPGIRTTIFLKGCSLHCSWCHNPECISPEVQVQFFSNRCTLCGSCVTACPVGAQLIIDEKRIYLRDTCQRIGDCVKACNFGALETVGREISTEEVISEVNKDRVFYQRLGGGITLSGGEPLLQLEFTREVLTCAKKNGLHTTVDTAGNVPWKNFDEVIPYTDLFLYDLKCIDPNKHREFTGSINNQILDNLHLLVKENKEIWIRIPLIPGFNDDPEDIHDFAVELQQMDRISKIQMIPYHKYGVGKYDSLGLKYELNKLNPPTEERIKQIVDLFLEDGITIEY